MRQRYSTLMRLIDSTLLAATAVLASAPLLGGCELIVGGDFDRQFVRSSKCVPACGSGERCDLETKQCVCAPAACEEGVCGARLDPGCGLAQDCGGCPSGQVCGGETANRCSTVGCTPQTCEQLGQTSGVHPSCGILVDCNPTPTCTSCRPEQVCTAQGCCTPFSHPEGSCGPLDDGCGNVAVVNCPEGTALTCENDKCCEPTCPRDAACGLNPSCGTYVDCEGTCADGTICGWDSETQKRRHVCGGCVGTCPSEAEATTVCGANLSTGCAGQIMQCPGQCPDDEKCIDFAADFRCCRPACPATPTACGANDDGCGGVIQCPGPCGVAGETCRTSAEGFACALP